MVSSLSLMDPVSGHTEPDSSLPDSLWERHKPLLAAAIILVAVTLGFCGLCAKKAGGHFIYPIDDVYIHLAISQNLAHHGVWGVNAEEGFAAAASSLLWPVQLAGLILVVGSHDWLPLVLNLVYGVLCLAGAYWVLLGAGASRKFAFGVLLLAILFTSLPVQILLGMEHTMQAAVDLLFAALAARYLAADRTTGKQLAWLGILAVVVTATRYEGMFLVLAFALCALLLRRWREAVLLPIVAVLPIVAFGLYSMAHGGLWLPNPIVVKSDFYEIHSLQDLLQLLTGPKLASFLRTTAVLFPVLFALLGVVLDAAGGNRLGTRERLFVLLVVLTAGMHLFGAATGWFTRYEAYLVFLGVIAAGVAWRPLLADARLRLGEGDGRRKALVGACVLLLELVLAAPVAQRVSDGFGHLQAASKNIHDQQYQMARFLGRNYGGQAVLINDLGAVSYFSEARPIDMAGLATVEVARAMVARPPGRTTEFVDQLARAKGARIAVVFTSWLPEGKAPTSWIKVGSWTVSDNIVCGDPTLDFYALDPEAAAILEANLREFMSSLPTDVKQAGRYTR